LKQNTWRSSHACQTLRGRTEKATILRITERCVPIHRIHSIGREVWVHGTVDAYLKYVVELAWVTWWSPGRVVRATDGCTPRHWTGRHVRRLPLQRDAASPDPQACLVDRCQQCATGRCARGIQIPTKRCRNQTSFDRRGCGEGLQLGLQPQQRTSFYALLNQRSRRLEALSIMDERVRETEADVRGSASSGPSSPATQAAWSAREPRRARNPPSTSGTASPETFWRARRRSATTSRLQSRRQPSAAPAPTRQRRRRWSGPPARTRTRLG
jgi:hypothetical protein